MTIKELIKELKQYPQDAHVYINNDWDDVDDNRNYNNLSKVIGVLDDVAIIDDGLDFMDEHRIILETE